jgi:multiple sugar transport system substrate-binding protein
VCATLPRSPATVDDLTEASVRRALRSLLLVPLVAACTTATATPQATVLRVVMADDWASAPVVAEVVDAFEREHEGVRVQLQGSPFSQIPDVVTNGVELGQPPDLAHWHAFAAGSAGIAQPVDDLWASEGLTADEYLAGAYTDVVWDGVVHGVPLDVNALVLMANVEQLDDADLTPADLRTPDTFREAAAALVDDGLATHAVTVTASSWATYGWIVANGGQLLETRPDGSPLLDVDGLPTFTFEDPGTITALELLVELIASGDAPPPFAPDLALDSIAAFATGDVAFHTSGSWDLPITRQAMQADVQFDDIMVLPLPQADPDHPRTVLGGSSLFVPVDAQHRDLAFELALALTQDDIALRLALEEGRLPARSRVYAEPVFSASPDLAAFVEQLPTAEVMPLIAYPEVAAAFRDGLETVLSLRVEPAEAMAQVQRFADAERER